MAKISPLRQRMIEDMTIRNLSQATQQSYVYAVRKFSRHFGRSPDRLGVEDVRAYQLHLIAQKRSWAHINQTACALRFFYGVTLGRQEAFERIVNGREPEKLPPVLTPEEIARFLEAVTGLRNRVALATAYAAGLRIGEVCRLKVSLDRQQAHADSHRRRQGREGSLRDAVATSAGYSARVLETSPPRPMAVSRSRARRSHRRRGVTGRLSGRAQQGQVRQTRHGPLPAPQLCDASPGKRRRASHHPGPARTFRAVVDDTLRAGRHPFDRQHAEPLRPALARGRAARISRARCARSWRWRTSSAATAKIFAPRRRNRLSLDQRKVMAAIEACRTPALGAHVERCEDCSETRISYNSCRNRHCPKCQGLSRLQWLADRRAELLPVAYFHVVFTVPAPIAAIALQNKARRLRYPVQGDGGDDPPHRGQPQTPWRRDRRGGDPAHVGADPHSPSPCSLHRAGRRSGVGWELDREQAQFLSPRPRSLSLLSSPVPGTFASRVRRRPHRFSRRACRVERSVRLRRTISRPLSQNRPGSSSPNALLPAPRRSSTISVATRIASPSPTDVFSIAAMAVSAFGGRIIAPKTSPRR